MTTRDPELSIACPSCSAPAGSDCYGFGYCPGRSAAAGDSDTQPDPYIDAMAAEHVNEFDPAPVLSVRTKAAQYDAAMAAAAAREAAERTANCEVRNGQG